MTGKPLKVCQLCAIDFTLKNFLLPLIDRMRLRGWEVVAVCSPGPFFAELRASGYRIEIVPIARSMSPLAALISLLALIGRKPGNGCFAPPSYFYPELCG
jgi:hypothetical protein